MKGLIPGGYVNSRGSYCYHEFPAFYAAIAVVDNVN